MPEFEVAVVGGGAVGSIVAAALIYGGHRFQWVVRNPARRRELNNLVVQFPHSGRDLPLGDTEILTSTWNVAPGIPVIVAVKAHNVDEAVSSLGAGRRTMVIANGLHQEGYALGLLYGGAYIRSGAVVTNMENELFIGCLDGAVDTTEFASLLQSPFLHVEQIPNIHELMWHKLAINCIVNPLTAMLDCENGELLGRLHGPLAQGLLREIEEVIRAAADSRFREPSRMELLAEIKQLLRATRENSSSMREDVNAGRETEISRMNQALAEYGAEIGIDCPLNLEISRVISLLAGRSSRRQSSAEQG